LKYDKNILNHIDQNNIKEIKRLLKTNFFDNAKNGSEAIEVASDFGYLEIVKLLLKDERIDPVNVNNYTIRTAYSNGHSEILELLWKDERIRKTLAYSERNFLILNINPFDNVFEFLTKRDIKNKLNNFL
jgi:hypothetical protein